MNSALTLTVTFFCLFGVARGDSPPAAGDGLQLWTCNASSIRQNFTVLPSSAGPPFVFLSLSAHRSLVLDLAGPSRAVGTPAHMWGRYTPEVSNQLWSLAGSALASDFAAGLCLAAESTNLGALLALATCSAGDPLQAFTADVVTGLIHFGASALCVQAGGPGISCALPPFSTYTYCNSSASLEARVADLVSRLTLEEKVAALDSGVPAISRLGVPSLHSGEALHGAATGCLPPNLVAPNSTGCPTSFPAPVALGATFDVGTIRAVGGAIGREARALEAAGIGALWLFAPNVNPSRDQKWGRCQEVAGEDSTVVSNYAVAFVSGLQGYGESSFLLAAATLKHYGIYDMEGFIPRTDPLPRPATAACDTPGGCQRWNFDASPSARDFNAYYMAPFTAVMSSVRARSVMCAYSALYGEAACGSPSLNTRLRGDLAWDGHVVSDCTAIELMGDEKWDSCQPPFPPLTCEPDGFPGHNFTHGVVDTANVALSSGTDVNCGPFYRMWLGALVANGSVAEAAINTAVTRLYRTAFLLGQLDPPSSVPWTQFGPSTVDSADHRALALSAAQKSIVLLKNERAALPLRTGARIAFIGPHANSTQEFLSNYHGTNTLVNENSPLMAARARGLDVTYARGCNICDSVPPGFPNMPCTQATDRSGFAAAVAAAAAADVAVLFIGSDQTTEAENFDRDALTLTGVQEDLALEVIASQPNTIVVFISGGTVSSPAIAVAAPAILYSFYGGEFGGVAIVDALAGDFSPAGRLPSTIYFPNFTSRDIRDVDLASAGGITHSFFTGPVLFPFGAGLSFSELRVTASWHGMGVGGGTHLALRTTEVAADGALLASLQVNVANVGLVNTDFVILVFVEPNDNIAHSSRRRQTLVAFMRVHDVAAGTTRSAVLDLHADTAVRAALGVFQNDGSWLPLPGSYNVRVEHADASPRLSLRFVVEP